MASLAAFSLKDLDGKRRSFPSGKTTLLSFVREECETCHLSMPVIEAVHQAYGKAINVWAVGQEDNLKLRDQHKATLPILDDTALKVSFNYRIQIVPTIILADFFGAEVVRWEAFHKGDWQDLIARLSQLTNLAPPSIDWDKLPALRPGCGSKSVEPGTFERLTAEAEGSPLRARQIEIAERDDPFEFMFDQGLTDGLPVIPPTPERVIRMLTGTRRDAQEVVGTCAPNYAPVTIEKIAINAVMAGCKPEYMPVVIAATEALCSHEFNAHALVSTYGPSPVMVVNGPIRNRIGMNMGINVLGHGNRANATIGRAIKLILRNLGGLRPGEIERAALGSPAKYGACYPEFEERSPWEPLHVERGFDRDDSVVTLFSLEGSPHQIADQTSRTARSLAGSLGLGMECGWHPKTHGVGDVLLVISPEHVDTLWRDRWTKDDVRKRIQEITSRPLRELLPTEDYGGLGAMPEQVALARGRTQEQLNSLKPKFKSPQNIHIIVAGGPAGKWSSVINGYGDASVSVPVSRKIEEVV
jgi:thiol-disulfide isomerase/thioredoxin